MGRLQTVMAGIALMVGVSACGGPVLMPRLSTLPMPVAAANTHRVAFATVTVDELHAMPMVTRAKLIDVREPDEFAAGHVPGATNVPLATVATWADKQVKDAPLLVICHSGRRSTIACQTLADKAFTRITNVEGGTGAWIAKGYPLDTAKRVRL